jgi:hypothetical protein
MSIPRRSGHGTPVFNQRCLRGQKWWAQRSQRCQFPSSLTLRWTVWWKWWVGLTLCYSSARCPIGRTSLVHCIGWHLGQRDKRPALPPCCARFSPAFLSQVAVYDSPVAHMDMVRLLIPGVMALVPLFDEGVRKRDDDQAKGIARVFAETGESYVDLILGEEEISQVPADARPCC